LNDPIKNANDGFGRIKRESWRNVMSAVDIRKLITALKELANRSKTLSDRFLIFDTDGLNSPGEPKLREELVTNVLSPLCELFGRETLLRALLEDVSDEEEAQPKKSANEEVLYARFRAQLVETIATAKRLDQFEHIRVKPVASSKTARRSG
jgi:hypothetical protein